MGDPNPVRGTAAEPAVRPDSTGWRRTFTLRWAKRLVDTSDIALPPDELQRQLSELVDVLAEALQDPGKVEAAGHAVGERLVDLHATGEGALPRTLELIRDYVVGESSVGAVGHLMHLLTAITAGFATAERERSVAREEFTTRALLHSKLRADRERDASDERFREVFTSTPVGVAICSLDGRFVEVNPALAETLGHRESDLLSMTIHDLFHPEEAAYLTAAYAELAEGGPAQRLRERRRLLRADGEQAWTYLAVSLLRDAEDEPKHFVTMVEDISELHLLQERFQYQALHDAMTGLANRQFFRTRLEAALGNLAPDDVLTLYHLGLDGFELINDGLGYEVGDSIIRAVARRLEQLVEGEQALVARFGGTEFAILVAESPRTAQIPEFAALINEELSEPIYIGEHGIATSASIGVVRRSVADGDPTSMIWEADVALRRAEIAGKRQWALFDPDVAPDERTEAKLAAIMPGALELGGFDVRYRPVADTGSGALVSVEAQLAWQPDGHEPLEHAEILRLAEGSGVTLELRDWMLRCVWEQLAEWSRAGHDTCVLIELSTNQSRDPDLVALVRGVLGAGDELDASWLHLCMPTDAVMNSPEEIRENIRVLRSMGVRTMLHSFRGAPQELRVLRELPVRGVRLAVELVELVNGRCADDEPEVRAVRQLVGLLRDSDVRVCVGDVHDEEQARWWQQLGCDFAVGPRYGEALTAGEFAAVLETFGPPQAPHTGSDGE